MMKIDLPQGAEDSSSDGFLRDAKNLEYDRYIIKNFLVEEQTKILEDHPRGSSQFINFMVWNP